MWWIAGFGNFFPKGGKGGGKGKGPGESGPPKGDKKSGADKTKKESSGSGSGGGGKGKGWGGSGGGAKPPPPPETPKTFEELIAFIMHPDNRVAVVAMFGAAAITASLFADGGLSGGRKEITYQEFRRNYLEEDKVESLTVVNKNMVRVNLRNK